MVKQNHTVFDLSLDPNSKTYLLGLRLDRTWRAPGVRLEWYWHGQYFYGKAEALIASGVAEEDWFPADWKQCKQTVDGRSITVRKKSKYGFEVFVKYSPEEEELAAAKERELTEAKERLDRQEKDLAGLPKTAAEYKAKELRFFKKLLRLQSTVLSCSESGFRFDENTIVEMKRLNAEMEFCLQHGRIVFDPAVQADTFARLKAARAKADPDFQKMMARLKDASKLPE